MSVSQVSWPCSFWIPGTRFYHLIYFQNLASSLTKKYLTPVALFKGLRRWRMKSAIWILRFLETRLRFCQEYWMQVEESRHLSSLPYCMLQRETTNSRSIRRYQGKGSKKAHASLLFCPKMTRISSQERRESMLASHPSWLFRLCLYQSS